MIDDISKNYPLRATGLAKRFGQVQAISNVSLEIASRPGQHWGYWGRTAHGNPPRSPC